MLLVVPLPILLPYLGCARIVYNYPSYDWKCLSLEYVLSFGPAACGNSFSVSLSTPLSPCLSYRFYPFPPFSDCRLFRYSDIVKLGCGCHTRAPKPIYLLSVCVGCKGEKTVCRRFCLRPKAKSEKSKCRHFRF